MDRVRQKVAWLENIIELLPDEELFRLIAHIGSELKARYTMRQNAQQPGPSQLKLEQEQDNELPF